MLQRIGAVTVPLLMMSAALASPAAATDYTTQENRAWRVIETSPLSRTLAGQFGKSDTVGLVRWVCYELDTDGSWNSVSRQWKKTALAVQKREGRAKAKRWLEFGAMVSVTAVKQTCPWHLSDPDIPF